MRTRGLPPFVRAASALAAVLVLLPLLGACTKGGQFDPTELFNSDMFDSKKKLSGQRVSVFPDGVPGTTTGVPADLVKGYQAPPDQSDADASQTPPPGGAPPAAPPKTASDTSTSTATADAKPKAKVRPKPKVASAPAQSQGQDPIWNQTQSGPPKSGPTRINVGAKPAPNGGQDSAQSQNAAPQASWPSPTPAQQVQSNWPSPQSSAPAQKTAQPSQSVWPNPQATTQ